eukprot:6186959-Lingulodinium_polyedra.AAC.1
MDAARACALRPVGHSTGNPRGQADRVCQQRAARRPGPRGGHHQQHAHSGQLPLGPPLALRSPGSRPGRG